MVQRTPGTNRHPARENHSRHLLGTLAAVLLALGGLFAAGYYLTGGFGLERRDLLREKFQAEHLAGIHPREDTGSLCKDKHCTAGWRTDVGDFLQFHDDGQAEYWQTVLGDDSRRDGRILLDLSKHADDLDARKMAIDVLFSEKDWS